MVVLRAKILRILGMLPLLGLLGGCNMVVMSPSGDVASQQRDLIVVSTILMLLIIVPVIAATLLFAWRYRASNKTATYDPDWHHSTGLEVLIWTAPLMIIIALGALTWISTHLLDPYRPIGRIDAARPVTAEMEPLTVEVVALDWKWMFFYPEYGIATVNELAAPVDRPIAFKLTSAAIMNSFFVPALAGQIYAMPGMQTQLHAVINKPGIYDGFSANYSGSGFSRMRFKFHGLDTAGFDAWVAKVKADGQTLDRARYLEVEKPSEAEPVHYYASVENGLYDAILGLCVEPGKMCMAEMMQIDAAGGGVENHEGNRERLVHDRSGSHEGFGHGLAHGEGSEAPGATFPASGRTPKSEVQPEGMQPAAASPAAAGSSAAPAGQGHEGHAMPGMSHDRPMPDAGSGETGSSSPAPAQLNQ
ncbi:ubiquinol oxidase subunit II [Aureimonas sp. AU12]|uniref:ubiquinol oxidase subunit II n=1 Tax=Aureimonas sp. AU12 TaxID=1638161 RepID=UPI000783F14F|nr:ubiquinol oxidase subunit II [Aureimonas sp. AU12]